MHLPAILAALALASPAAVSAAALDHSRSCIFACPQTTHAGAGWTSSLRAALLRCSYTDAASCLYARTDGALVPEDSSESCAPHAPRSCVCEYTCPDASVLSGRQVTGARTAAEPDTLVCTFARGLACAYSSDTGRLVGTTSFCPTQAVDTCRAARTTYAGEDDAQAAIRRRFRVQRRALSGARAHE